MSWQEYITNLLSNEGVEDATIIGLDGSVWAACETGWLKDLSVRTCAHTPQVTNMRVKLNANNLSSSSMSMAC